MTGYLLHAFIYLAAAVITVPLAKRMGLGSVLGYLIAGVIIGPVIGLVGDETVVVQHFAEFGVVMMLFLVGLELEPRMLWAMRHRLLGLGGLQMGLTSAAITGIGIALEYDWRISLAVGLIFSLSSTAIVLQTFTEKGLGKTEGGRAGFSVLLFQDIAVIFLIALIPLLAQPELQQQAADMGTHGESWNLTEGMPAWASALMVVAAVGLVIFGGHFLSRPLFRFVADTGLREIFTATALMLVIGISALMGLVGLSPALGTFLAGVMLANSEFRHELETTIEPFKGLLLGLFFITVGAGVEFELLSQNLGTVVMLTLVVMLLKALVLVLLAVIFRIKKRDGWLLTLSLAQAGEFGFVLLGYSAQNAVLSTELVQMLSLVVALSMFLTPLLFIIFDKLVVPRYQQSKSDREADTIDIQGTVIVAGIGRFGQIVNRLLTANGINTVVLDHEAGQIDNMRKINIKSFYGDATRLDLLHTAGLADASLLVVAIDDRVRSVELVAYVKQTYPGVKVLARGFDRGHSYALRDAGADFTVNETYYSALALGRQALRDMGVHPFKSEQLVRVFNQAESTGNDHLYQSWLEQGEDNRFGTSYQKLFMGLEDTLKQEMATDRDDRHSRSQRGWTPPPKGYTDGLASGKLPTADHPPE